MNRRKSTILEDRDNWQAEAERLRAINRDLLAALEQAEWVYHREQGEAIDRCPSCDGEQANESTSDYSKRYMEINGSGHRPDCPLAAAIAKAKSPT